MLRDSDSAYIEAPSAANEGGETVLLAVAFAVADTATPATRHHSRLPPVAYLETRQGEKATPPARTSRRKRGGGGPAPLLLLRLGMAADTPHAIR